VDWRTLQLERANQRGARRAPPQGRSVLGNAQGRNRYQFPDRRITCSREEAPLSSTSWEAGCPYARFPERQSGMTETMTGRRWFEKLREDGELSFPNLWELQRMEQEIGEDIERGRIMHTPRRFGNSRAMHLWNSFRDAVKSPDIWCGKMCIPLDSEEAAAIRAWAALKRLTLKEDWLK
jgi:hypothetical protein